MGFSIFRELIKRYLKRVVDVSLKERSFKGPERHFMKNCIDKYYLFGITYVSCKITPEMCFKNEN